MKSDARKPKEWGKETQQEEPRAIDERGAVCAFAQIVRKLCSVPCWSLWFAPERTFQPSLPAERRQPLRQWLETGHRWYLCWRWHFGWQLSSCSALRCCLPRPSSGLCVELSLTSVRPTLLRDRGGQPVTIQSARVSPGWPQGKGVCSGSGCTGRASLGVCELRVCVRCMVWCVKAHTCLW